MSVISLAKGVTKAAQAINKAFRKRKSAANAIKKTGGKQSRILRQSDLAESFQREKSGVKFSQSVNRELKAGKSLKQINRKVNADTKERGRVIERDSSGGRVHETKDDLQDFGSAIRSKTDNFGKKFERENLLLDKKGGLKRDRESLIKNISGRADGIKKFPDTPTRKQKTRIIRRHVKGMGNEIDSLARPAPHFKKLSKKQKRDTIRAVFKGGETREKALTKLGPKIPN